MEPFKCPNCHEQIEAHITTAHGTEPVIDNVCPFCKKKVEGFKVSFVEGAGTGVVI